MTAYGPPIVKGAISTVLAVVPLFFIPSYIQQTFSKMVVLVIFCGALHGLIIIPAMMATLQSAITKFQEALRKIED